MDLQENKKLASVPGDFGAKVTGRKTKKLSLPPEIYTILASFGITTAEGFYDAIYAERVQDLFQRALEKQCGWSVTDFMNAAGKLKTVLHGHVSDHLLYPVGRPKARAKRSESRKRRKRIRVPV